MLNKLKQYKLTFKPNMICITAIFVYVLALIANVLVRFYWLDVFVGLVIIFLCAIYMIRVEKKIAPDFIKEIREKHYGEILDEVKHFDQEKEKIKNKIYVYKNKNTFNANPFSR